MLWYSVPPLHIWRKTQEFAGRAVLITGAARGLGRATARRFLELGAEVAVNVRDATRAQALARALGPDVLPVTGDVSRAEDVGAMVASVLDRFKPSSLSGR